MLRLLLESSVGLHLKYIAMSARYNDQTANNC
jgi:hypothetical protein